MTRPAGVRGPLSSLLSPSLRCRNNGRPNATLSVPDLHDSRSRHALPELCSRVVRRPQPARQVPFSRARPRTRAGRAERGGLHKYGARMARHHPYVPQQAALRPGGCRYSVTSVCPSPCRSCVRAAPGPGGSPRCTCWYPSPAARLCVASVSPPPVVLQVTRMARRPPDGTAAETRVVTKHVVRTELEGRVYSPNLSVAALAVAHAHIPHRYTR